MVLTPFKSLVRTLIGELCGLAGLLCSDYLYEMLVMTVRIPCVKAWLWLEHAT